MTLRLPALAALDRVRLTEHVSVRLQRTLRIPDDGRDYPLPPSLGAFPVYRAADLPGARDAWRGRDYVVPIHQREALWLDFDARHWHPSALKVGIGGIDAISGARFDPTTLTPAPQDYLVIPDQPWLDGINAGDGFIRQFVAVALGEGLSVEAQLSGEESEGGLELAAFDARPGCFPDEPPAVPFGAGYALPCACEAPMGLGAGGRMRQEIYEDEYGAGTWADAPSARVRIELVDAIDFSARTGLPVPPTPVDAAAYTRHGLPWFELYDPVRSDVAPSDALAGARSIGELLGERDEPVRIHPGQVVSYVGA